MISDFSVAKISQKVLNMKNPVAPDYGSDPLGHFGDFGGRYAPEMLMPALIELEKAYSAIQKDESFQNEYFHWD